MIERVERIERAEQIQREALSRLREKIEKLKKERRAVILAHNYQYSAVQEIADFVGDSLQLARKATELECEMIVFCGVKFMAETAAILNPDKEVVIPHPTPLCSLAGMLSRDYLLYLKKKHPEAASVVYVNSLAETKAEADYVCTSANAAELVSKIEAEEVIFGPDANLAWFAQQKNPSKKIIPAPPNGFCYVHVIALPEDIQRARQLHPEAKVMVHPECWPEVQKLADHVGSTSKMLKYALSEPAEEFVVGTEIGHAYRLAREMPDKKFYFLRPDMVCAMMKANTVEGVYLALRDRKYKVKVDEKIAERARKAIERMLELSV